VLTSALAPHADGVIEHVSIPAPGGDTVCAALALAAGDDRLPTILCTNGLEGTVPEILLPAMTYRHRGWRRPNRSPTGPRGHCSTAPAAR
jgi:esterase FrsA